MKIWKALEELEDIEENISESEEDINKDYSDEELLSANHIIRRYRNIRNR